MGRRVFDTDSSLMNRDLTCYPLIETLPPLILGLPPPYGSAPEPEKPKKSASKTWSWSPDVQDGETGLGSAVMVPQQSSVSREMFLMAISVLGLVLGPILIFVAPHVDLRPSLIVMVLSVHFSVFIVYCWRSQDYRALQLYLICLCFAIVECYD